MDGFVLGRIVGEMVGDTVVGIREEVEGTLEDKVGDCVIMFG